MTFDTDIDDELSEVLADHMALLIARAQGQTTYSEERDFDRSQDMLRTKVKELIEGAADKAADANHDR